MSGVRCREEGESAGTRDSTAETRNLILASRNPIPHFRHCILFSPNSCVKLEKSGTRKRWYQRALINLPNRAG